jgi:superfamily I DNA/RNA helicase
VLYRTNSQSRLVEEALRRYQIQYHMVGGFSFYDRAEVKDILSYMKLVQNPHDSIALGRGRQLAAARHRQDHDGDVRSWPNSQRQRTVRHFASRAMRRLCRS